MTGQTQSSKKLGKVSHIHFHYDICLGLALHGHGEIAIAILLENFGLGPLGNLTPI